ncbi:hypothetical protein PGH07_03335 [Sulfurovum sp. zt1-1]|uniref:HNH endonuclease n=1 Tax=Sulfurovum zhangzhouensis TaxID=3019067 RepID=A0ABT7QWI7_9BACT|nr:hypothetical protein [Sulfurovum zhangzhouensis]MDM5271200.1 hypothetical protein [Sulfurovum zhangzhouensis]
MKKNIKCYMCDSDAVSSEHVPPKCLFPESKDVEGENYRKHLITVPSCEIHNSAKSKDDEFLMISLAGIIGNNSIGYLHKFTKVNRAIRRTANRLLDKAFTSRKHYYLKRDNGFLEVIWGTPDHERLISCFEHIAYGLHYYHLGKCFKGKVNVLLGYLHSEDEGNNTFVQYIKDRAAIDLKDIPEYGENRDIFYYQFSDPDDNGIYMVHMRFYGGIDIYASFLPEDKPKPFDLGIELMNAGIETVFVLDGKEYRVKKANKSEEKNESENL